jgi:hypothetical protein
MPLTHAYTGVQNERLALAEMDAREFSNRARPANRAAKTAKRSFCQFWQFVLGQFFRCQTPLIVVGRPSTSCFTSLSALWRLLPLPFQRVWLLRVPDLRARSDRRVDSKEDTLTDFKDTESPVSFPQDSKRSNARKRSLHQDPDVTASLVSGPKVSPSVELARPSTSTSNPLAPETETHGESTKNDLAEILGPELTARLQGTLGTTDLHLTLRLLIQANQAAGCFKSFDTKSLVSYFPAAALASLGVRDGLEALLAVQMVSVHSLAMEFLAKVAVKNQTEAGIELYVNRANKLLRTFTTQMEALKKHRSTGEQHVTVEHVTVQNGGQAVVGTVNLSPKRTQPQQGEQAGGGDKQNAGQ